MKENDGTKCENNNQKVFRQFLFVLNVQQCQEEYVKNWVFSCDNIESTANFKYVKEPIILFCPVFYVT